VVRCACIDIGSNTTRLLVAERDGAGLERIHEQRVFTHIGRDLAQVRALSQDKLLEVREVVASQLQRARELGANDVCAVATAAIRRASNGAELAAAIRADCGLKVEILSAAEEARLAFAGAAWTMTHPPAGDLGVVDVGGGSSELVVGSPPNQVSWFASFGLGSGELSTSCLASDPPSAAELTAAQERVRSEFAGLEAPRPVEAVAVGGSAASLSRLAGALLDAEAFRRALRVLVEKPAREVADLFGLEVERVRLLPAGLLILQAASECLRAPLRVVPGGLREGVLLERFHG
jgi:exopolyphosphatase / guanosine-5'-triphosphate,3'-diphosphate pyrophosphatase